MKRVMMPMTLIALLAIFVGTPMIIADDDTPVGFEIGIGHIDYPGEGIGLGHDRHDCNPTCPCCGGYPCIPPCTGVCAALPENEDEPSFLDEINQMIWILLGEEVIR